MTTFLVTNSSSVRVLGQSLTFCLHIMEGAYSIMGINMVTLQKPHVFVTET